MNQIELLPESLPNWAQGLRGIPNALARSALFCVGNPRIKERRYFNGELIAATGGITLMYTGSELRQDDLDVFLQVLHLAKEQKLGENIQFTAWSMILAMGWAKHMESYQRLSACMIRMKATALCLTVESRTGSRMGFAGSLIGQFDWRETGSNEPLREWSVSLEQKIVLLFEPAAYSLLNWRTRLDLPPLAARLHSYYSTHREPFPVSTELLHKISGSKIKELRKFRYELRAALILLVTNGFFLEAHIDTKSDLVYVVRAFDRKLLE